MRTHTQRTRDCVFHWNWIKKKKRNHRGARFCFSAILELPSLPPPPHLNANNIMIILTHMFFFLCHFLPRINVYVCTYVTDRSLGVEEFIISAEYRSRYHNCYIAIFLIRVAASPAHFFTSHVSRRKLTQNEIARWDQLWSEGNNEACKSCRPPSAENESKTNTTMYVDTRKSQISGFPRKCFVGVVLRSRARTAYTNLCTHTNRLHNCTHVLICTRIPTWNRSWNLKSKMQYLRASKGGYCGDNDGVRVTSTYRFPHQCVAERRVSNLAGDSSSGLPMNRQPGSKRTRHRHTARCLLWIWMKSDD